MEGAILTVLAYGLIEIGANSCHSKKVAFFSILVLFYAQ